MTLMQLSSMTHYLPSLPPAPAPYRGPGEIEPHFLGGAVDL
jgi:hypothetical protein